ncbi:DUF6233 domain-containing protein [Streptomyces alboniger]|uniref:DUF6233 domain-containing protein n=1 Tax=Streptomyces alboniger TaxID=132473 RepID=UPI000AED8E3D
MTPETWPPGARDDSTADTEKAQRQAEQAEGERRRPPVPGWIIEEGVGDGLPAGVHVGGCYAALKWPRALGVSREQAREALYQQVLACPHCILTRISASWTAPEVPDPSVSGSVDSARRPGCGR